MIELIVSMVIGGILLSLTLSLLVSNRKLYVEDLARNEVNQNLRAAMDLIGTDLKQAGERITEENFPVIEIQNIDAQSSELTVRLNLDLPVLRNCQNIVTGTSKTISIPTNCANTIEDLEQWQAYRCSLDGVPDCQGNPQEKVRVFIHDGNGLGEYFTYVGENTSTLEINSSDGTNWLNSYNAERTMYILQERRYRLFTNVINTSPTPTVQRRLQLIVDGQDNRPLNIVSGISSFKVKASIPNIDPDPEVFPYTHTDGTAYRWWRLQSVKVSLQAVDPSPGAFKIAENKLNINGQFFPRNSLSR